MEQNKIFICQQCGKKNKIQSDYILFAKCGNCSEVLFDFRENIHENDANKELEKTEESSLLSSVVTVYFIIFIFFYYTTDDFYFSVKWPIGIVNIFRENSYDIDKIQNKNKSDSIKQLTGFEGKELFDPLSIPKFSTRYKYFNEIYNASDSYIQDEVMLKTYVHYNEESSLRIEANFQSKTNYKALYAVWKFIEENFNYKQKKYYVNEEKTISLGYYNPEAYLGKFSGKCQDFAVMTLELMVASGNLNTDDVYIASGSNHMWLKIYIHQQYYYVDQGSFLPYNKGIEKSEVIEEDIFNVGILLRRIIDFSS